MVSQALLGAAVVTENDEESSKNNMMMPLLPILIFVWIFVPLVKHSRASTFNLLTKTIMFIMLASMSVLYNYLGGAGNNLNLPPIFPDTISDIDVTFGFLTSFFVLPLLHIAEDRIDYSQASSVAPVNSA